jgi:flagellin-like hook-associated protein FlgL
MITSGVSFDATTHTLVRNYARNNQRVGVAVEQLSTGKRINRPSDDPTGFVAAEGIRGELIELRSQGRAETYRRVHFVRQQAAQATVRATSSRDATAAPQSPAEKPINVAPLAAADLVDTQVDSVSSFSPGTRIDQVFTQLREDKEIILTDALSQIEDTDFAVATAELAQGQVLTNAAVAALAYATQQLSDQFAELVATIDITAE